MMFTVEAKPTPGGKLAVKATGDGGLGSTTKYIVGGYPFYVIRAFESSVTWKDGEPVFSPSIGLTVVKRTRSKEVAMREFDRDRRNSAVFWKTPDGSYRLAARGTEITPPE